MLVSARPATTDVTVLHPWRGFRHIDERAAGQLTLAWGGTISAGPRMGGGTTLGDGAQLAAAAWAAAALAFRRVWARTTSQSWRMALARRLRSRWAL